MTMRMAGSGLKRLLGAAWDSIRPHHWTDVALDYAPDLLFAARAAATAPEGWALPLAAEDLSLGLGASLLGRVGGEVVGRKLLKLDPVRDLEKLNQLRMAGSMATSFTPALLGFRPVTEAMIQSQENDLKQQQAMAQEEELKHMQEQALAATVGGVGLAARGPWNLLPGNVTTM